MLEAAQHNNSMSDNYAIFANSTMYTHSPHRIQPMPPPPAKAPDPVCTIKAPKRICTSLAGCDLRPAMSIVFLCATGCGLMGCRCVFWCHSYLLTRLRPKVSIITST